jgi:ribosome-associated heat shock protein Hsp15
MVVQYSESVRLDRWLWAARFFKTRRFATEAIQAGKITLDGVRGKPGRAVKPGQRLTIRKGAIHFEIEVKGLAEQRGPASVAEALYRETPESLVKRERQRAEWQAAKAAQPRPDHRPDRRDRRRLSAFKRGGED